MHTRGTHPEPHSLAVGPFPAMVRFEQRGKSDGCPRQGCRSEAVPAVGNLSPRPNLLRAQFGNDRNICYMPDGRLPMHVAGFVERYGHDRGEGEGQ
jgi:hypothetical protein